jgi:Ca2+-binding EF-hand superfamily protein
MRRSQLVVFTLLGAFVLVVFAASSVDCSANTLPKGLPKWFKDMADDDGQISLPAWKKTGKTLDAFRQFDLNRDGFITPDEVLQSVQRGLPLNIEKGRVSHQGVIEQAQGDEPGYRDKKAFNAFTVRLQKGTTYLIEQSSHAYFSFLFLEGASGQVLASHDSGGVGKTARIAHRAAWTGAYRIIATSQGGFAGGPFSLTIRALPGLGGAAAKDIPAWFWRLDADYDGQISVAEWLKAGRKPEEFRKYDLNGDGLITAEEVILASKRRPTRRLPKGLPSWFKTLDTDEDGQVSLAEWRKAGRRIDDFHRYDANGDGFIAPVEVLRTAKRGLPLPLEKRRTLFQGNVETTQEPYQGRMAYQILVVKFESGKTYQIEQTSSTYFSFLFLEGPTGEVLAHHDSGGFGQTARIVHKAEATGAYRVIATSQAGVRTGPYTLTIRVLTGGAVKGVPSWFWDLDTNDDGQVTLGEWRQGGRKPDEFHLYDLNGDRLITPQEVLRTMKRGLPLVLEKGRVNYKGKIEGLPEEPYRNRRAYAAFAVKLQRGRTYLIEHTTQSFGPLLFIQTPDAATLDSRQSGGWWQSARVVHRPTWGGEHRIIATSHDGSQRGPFTLTIRALPSGVGPAGKEVPSWFWDADANEDGQVSLAEWRKAGRKPEEFRRYDLNGDGLITPDEIVRGGKRGDRLTLVSGEATYKGSLEPTGEAFFGRKVYHFFTVHLESGRTYRIEQTSQAYQSVIAVQGPDNQFAGLAGAPATGQPARVVHRAVKSGAYRIISTNQNDNQTGPFTLSVRVVGGMGGVNVHLLPPWFWQLDADGDGQISLAEWRKGGKPLDEFRKHDLDGDGLVTADEVQRFVQRQAKQPPKKPRRGRR